MTSARWQPDPIQGFQRLTEPGRMLVVADRWVPSVSTLRAAASGSLLAALCAEGAAPVSAKLPQHSRTLAGSNGRGPTMVVPLPGSDSQLHLRPVRHGGWLGDVRGQALLGLQRPLDELRVTALLAEQGAPVPSPVLVIAERVGPFWNAAVGTVFEPDTVNGISFLSGAPDRTQLLHAAAAAGRAIARFHDRGGSHGDLHIGNLLLRTNPQYEVIVVDLDRAKHTKPVSPAQRMRELMRLQRSLIKRQLAGAVGARGYSRFLAEYTAGNRTLRGELFSYLGRERLRNSLHAVRYAARQ